ncbi:MAG: PLP-dependent aminotransferase family protein [Clostridia bacterium]|nr:PLP-dependent aminotransferase family protein [Clostridia bacterium]
MKYTVDKNIKKPAYIQLYENIRKDITSGVLPFGGRLPSKRLVSEEIGVSIITVEHAYSLLIDEGYAVARERSGYYVSYSAEDGFKHPETAPRLIRPHQQSQKYDFPFSVYAKTMRKVISDYGEEILLKTDNTGCDELKTAISEYLLRSRGISVSKSRIVIGSGAEYLYGIIIQLLGRDRSYATEDPSYEKIEAVYHANGVDIQLLKLGSDGILTEELNATNATVLHITPYRSYPSGITASASKRYEYLRWAGREKIIIEDDYESEFSILSKPEETLFAMSNNDNVVYLNTFSKTISPAVRTGYMVLPEKLLSEFNERVGFYSSSVPTFEQLVIAEFISSGNFERHINRIRRKKRREM